MKLAPILSVLVMATSAAALAQTQPTATATQPTATPNSARAVFMNKQGEAIGTATLIETPNGLLITAKIANLPPGIHGFQFTKLEGAIPRRGSSRQADTSIRAARSTDTWSKAGPTPATCRTRRSATTAF